MTWWAGTPNDERGRRRCWGYLTDLQASVSYRGARVEAVKNDLAAVQGEVHTLQGLGTAPGTDYSATVAAGDQALLNAATAISWAQDQGNSINEQAHQLASTAQAYANSHCAS